MKILEEGDQMLNHRIENSKENLTNKMDGPPVSSKAPAVKVDGIADLENLLRLIKRNAAKGNNKKDTKGNEARRSLKSNLENGPKNNNSYPVDPLAIATPVVQSSKGKPAESNPSDTVEVLRQMLDKAFQALKLHQNKLSEAKKLHEASQLEIQKLQDQVRNLKAQINPPQLQLMKGASSMSRSKRKRTPSPFSSGSTSRSTSSSRHHSSRRSESPPQLSPAFMPRTVPASLQYGGSKRVRDDSPLSYVSDYYDLDSKHTRSSNRDSENHRFPDLDKGRYNSSSATSSSQRLGGESPSKNLKANMKNTSHLSHRKSSQKLFKSSNIYTKYRSSSEHPRGSRVSLGSSPSFSKQTLLSTLPYSAGSSSASKAPPLKTYGSTRSANRVNDGLQRGLKAPSSVSFGKSYLKDLGPPRLESNAEHDSEDEFSFSKNDEDEDSDELFDLDDDPPTKSDSLRKATSGAQSHNSSRVPSSTKLSSTKGSASLRMPNIRTSSSMPSSPLSSVGSNKSSKVGRPPKFALAGVRKFRSSTLNSSSAAAESSAGSKLRKRPGPSSKLRENRHSYPLVTRRFMEKDDDTPQPHITVSPFPPRAFEFDPKIDYSRYRDAETPQAFSDPVPDPFVFKDEPDKGKGETKVEPGDGPSTSKAIVNDTKKTIRSVNDRFSVKINDDENFMMAVVPYEVYQSESKLDFVDFDDDGSGKPEKKCASLVEIPRWRERIFDPLDLRHVHLDENLDDQVFLKRHNKNEINERRRKRWDSQRMREESYLERLKRKREERENQKKYKRKRGKNQVNDKSRRDDDILTFQPLINDAVYISSDSSVPITIFGYPMPIIEEGEFDLPWALPTQTPKSPSKVEVVVAPTPKSTHMSAPHSSASKRGGIKSALRQQPKR